MDENIRQKMIIEKALNEIKGLCDIIQNKIEEKIK